MGLREGDMIRSKINGIEGIITGFDTSKGTGLYHTILIFCTYSPHNSRYINCTIPLRASSAMIERIWPPRFER